MASSRGLHWSRSPREYAYTECDVGPARVFLVKPLTYMNLAGRGLVAFVEAHGAEPSELLVVTDDIDLPLGQLRLRRRGSHGGHNGLRSIIEELNTADFPRLRMGVGPVPPDEDPAEFVLTSIPTEQRAVVDRLVERAVSCIDSIVTSGFDRAMSLYNAAEVDRESI
jgi:PTH1 family peptidyl-tRNA hydrolase